MKDEKKIETLAASYAAHGIRTREDFAAYCRPPRLVCCLFAAFGVFVALAVAVMLHAAGMIPARWIVYGVAVAVPVAFASAFGLPALFDSI